jgi:hypothetical protein
MTMTSTNTLNKHLSVTWPIVFKHIGSVFVTPAGITREAGLAAFLAAFFAVASTLGWKQ